MLNTRIHTLSMSPKEKKHKPAITKKAVPLVNASNFSLLERSMMGPTKKVKYIRQRKHKSTDSCIKGTFRQII